MKNLLLWLWLLAFTSLVACRNAEQRASGSASAAASVALLPSAEAVSSTASAIVEQSAVVPSPWTRLLLFRVATKNKPSYLFGTIHLPDPRLDIFPPTLKSAIGESDVVFTEIPMDETTQSAIAPTLMLPQGQSLVTVVPAPLYQRVSAAFSQQGFPFAPFEKMKPWAVSVQLAVLDRLMTLAFEKPIDALIYQHAQQEDKETNGLETAREQLSIFDALTRSEQIELLRLTMEYRDTARANKRDVLGELLDAYLSGDADAITKLAREAYAPNNALALKLMKRVFSDRNKSLAERIVAQIEARPDKRQFFAVGCGHVVGDDGIVARLQKRNFEVVRIGEP